MDVFEKVEGVAKVIGVAPSTVKKYYLLFEQEGYRFKRSHEGYVLFSTHDIDLLKELMILKNQPGMTVQKAVREIVQQEGITDTTGIMDTSIDVTVISQQVKTVMTEITELKQALREQNELIKQQQEYIQNHFEEDMKQRQHDRELVTSLKESMDQQKQIAAAQEEKKKGFFARLFGK